MALDRNTYRALESIVGAENISEDPAILLGYAFSPFGLYPETGKFTPARPEAVLMPGTLEDVQGIVITCNKYNVRFKAHSTGWGPWGLAGAENIVLLDLRRMNRIIDIDEKNMFAVIEPGVVAAQLQAEVMKKGLDCHIVGAGPGHSPLASATSFQGMGNKGMTTSTNDRNLLGVEWVLPSGEVLRLGSPGAGAGWFSGDGPGPSLRGIMRGYVGACGGLGIFTKIGFKLYPWAGEREPHMMGNSPQFFMRVPPNTKFYYAHWETWEDMIEATYQIGEAEVAHSLSRTPPDALDYYLTKTNTEFYTLHNENALPFQLRHRMGWSSIITGHSTGEFNFKKKVFEKIVTDTNGQFFDLTPEQEALLYTAAVKVCYLPRVARPTGDFCTTFGLDESMMLLKRVTEAGEVHRKPYVDAEHFVDDGPEGFWGWPYENGRYIHWENAYSFDPRDIESRKAGFEFIAKTAETIERGGLGIAMIPNLLGPFADRFGPKLDNAQVWMRRIKNAFDPDNASDHSFYVSPKAPA